ncbi:hypothetical protein [Bradyrhizobium glycinis]|uniref:hypothetical protein n=1 Tax=Bradyrhizobium glycinis TaxID=2751812 RepID=UPI0018D90712|nr:hypothetical protein [Bradyrhizobium glycinis]MBH5370983.1 hypothetical protein [Bradyrhizobium glycinis]
MNVSLSTISRTKRVESNLAWVLRTEPHQGEECKLTGKEEALLIATVCVKRPADRKRWTLTLLADTIVNVPRNHNSD